MAGADSKDQAFRVKLSVRFKKPMAAYCGYAGLPPDAVFKYEGRRIKADDTVASVGIAAARAEAIEDGEDAEDFQVQIDVSPPQPR